jgi:catechol 2,3-dioxygenase-like lactoylglutathione lyase family enzyme
MHRTGSPNRQEEIPMKRLHVHVAVDDLDRSIGFYSTLFGAPPAVLKADYAKWMLDDPRVNFAVSSGRNESKGIEHLGIQVESRDELAEVYGRLKAADRPLLDEGATTCCYARSEKSWIADPDGILWEAFLTHGEATLYGDGPALGALAQNAADPACCDETTPQGVCCDPRPGLAADSPCCGAA